MNKRSSFFNRTLRTRILILGILLLALAIRLYELSSIPLNVDEISTVLKYAALPVLDIFRTNHSNNHPLASLLAHLFSPQTDHLFMMRWPFVLIGMLSLPVLYRLVRGLFDQQTGLLALLLISVAPPHIGYSASIRGYIGLITLTTVSLYLFWRALQDNRWQDWLGLVGVNLLIIYFHLFGLLAAGAQFALVGGWLFWHLYRNRAELTLLAGGKLWRVERAGLRARLVKFGVAAAGLSLLYPPLLYVRVNSILTNERWPSDFAAWQNPTFSLSEDLSPLLAFVALLGPLSPGGIGLYVYLLLALVGLAALWRRYRALALMTIGWFGLPMLAIFLASSLLGATFYVYFRFLLYLLPPFLILVALGLATFDDWLFRVASWRGQLAGRALALVALLLLLGLSVHWYLLTGTHADWLRLSKLLSAQLGRQDLVICEEHQRGFVIPDRAKPHCMWMLDYFVPQLRGKTYTPQFQSTTDFVANYENLQAQRQQLQGQSAVWLIIWQKIPFHPGQWVTDQRPPVLSPPPLAAFAPYPAWHFGSSTLVQINSERTLLGNLYKAVELLARVEEKPADKARYYRSLAEIEAVQGHGREAQAFFEKSWAMVEQAGGEYPDLFLAKTQPIVARVPEWGKPSGDTVAMNFPFGTSLCLQGYDVSNSRLEAGEALQLKLYWQTTDFIREDYTFFIQLEANSQPGQLQVEFQPFDGTYPTPWWWAGQHLVEAREFHLPPDLPGQDYLIYLGAYDRQQPEEPLRVPLFKLLSEPREQPGWRMDPLLPAEQGCGQSQ